MSDNSWRQHGACLNHFDPDAWFVDRVYLPSEKNQSSRTDFASLDRAAMALAVCASCPVRAECLQDSLATEETVCYGITGGLMPAEKMRLAGMREAGYFYRTAKAFERRMRAYINEPAVAALWADYYA